MSRSTRTRFGVLWVVSVIAALAAGAFLVWILTGAPTVLRGDGVIAQPPEPFTISGDLAEPISPGVVLALDLSISNPHETTLVVMRLDVEVDAVDAPNATEQLSCDVDDFTVEPLSADASVVLAAGESSTLSDLGIPREQWPQVGMTEAPTNQDGCKQASLTLVYTATGRFEQ